MENCAYLRKNPGYAPENVWSDVPRTFLTIPVTLAQPKQCFVCAKFAQKKSKTLCSLLVFTQLFRQEIKNAVFFAQFT